MRWSLVEPTGTGKSTIAQLLASLIYAMGLTHSETYVSVKGEALFGVTDYQMEQVLQGALEKAAGGMIFFDVDAFQTYNRIIR